MSRMNDLRKWRDCEHDWAWEAGRMLCARCGWKRPTDDTLDYAQGRIAELEADVARSIDREEQTAFVLKREKDAHARTLAELAAPKARRCEP